ncbi:MAG: M24 family metallopeptidase [Gammaproteobacteria bacterium]
MDRERRDFIAAATMAGAVAGVGASAAPGTSGLAQGPTHGLTPQGNMLKPSLPDIGFATREPFLDRERARRILTEDGLDAMVVGEGRNVFHATNFFPLLERMSMIASTLAIIPRDPQRPVALVIPAFSYYYIQADDGGVPGVQPFVFTSPRPGAAAGDVVIHKLDGEPPAREQNRRKVLAAAAPYHASMEQALGKALAELGVARGRLGHDDSSVAQLLTRAAPAATLVDADDTPRRIRLVRTAAEIRMMKLASEANVAAAHATIRAARELGSVRAIRQRFFAEAALRGNLGVFMVVNASSSDAYDEPLRDGQALMIDCVSHLRNFHGDYGRTIFFGEPNKRMRYCTDAMAKTWGELQGLIRPDMRFSQVRELGTATLAKFGIDVPVTFSPHSVGLAHTDQPRLNVDGSRTDIIIEENMILSIDCPLFETGEGGTAHLEDLVLVRSQGTVPIHDTGTPTYTV